jgi:phosphoribosylcarboxyaminoimidazole (NCAIR) mutase
MSRVRRVAMTGVPVTGVPVTGVCVTGVTTMSSVCIVAAVSRMPELG